MDVLFTERQKRNVRYLTALGCSKLAAIRQIVNLGLQNQDYFGGRSIEECCKGRRRGWNLG